VVEAKDKDKGRLRVRVCAAISNHRNIGGALERAGAGEAGVMEVGGEAGGRAER